ncbi:MAG: class I SAM-dependent methyltransferase [Armatimonadetes bacterium]|nr:class I SAM-dependent methyltransferase [Armatimonadota bacterium]
MRRLHLFEIEDQPWCPAVVRDAMTDYLRTLFALGKPYAPALPLLREAVVGSQSVVDLCSGGGGPWVDFSREVDVPVVLTDWYPNHDAFARAAECSGGQVRGHGARVDATAVPPELRGFRTLFTSFHHFAPAKARAILRDAVRAGEGIAIFEITRRRWSTILLIGLTTAPIALLLSLAARPVSWLRLALHWLIPVVPLACAFDGVVSCLRSYTPDELLAMAREAAPEDYEWRSGEAWGWGPIPVTYLVGRKAITP